MAAQANAQPIIIKRKKKGGGDGHHGGAWKVAYADFVTAMMAFFMLMWLLNATTEKQRKGIADYFAPTIAVNRVSGGGDGIFGGDSVFTEETLARNGSGATSLNASNKDKASGSLDGEQERQFETLEADLKGRTGESDVHKDMRKHIVTRVTDEGLVIEVFALPDAPIFEEDGVTPTPLLEAIAVVIAESSRIVTNQIAVSGHVPSEPIVKQTSSVWETSSRQATEMRLLLEGARVDPKRIKRVAGYADREPTEQNPLSVENNRLEVIFLRR